MEWYEKRESSTKNLPMVLNLTWGNSDAVVTLVGTVWAGERVNLPSAG